MNECLGKVKVGLHLFNFKEKTDLKNATGIDTLSFAKKVHLASFEFNVNNKILINSKIYQVI